MARIRAKAVEETVSPKGETISSEIIPGNPPAWDTMRHFTPREFACKCDNLCDHAPAISMETVSKLEKIRDLLGRPVTILSGTRCEKHNRKVGGKQLSAHLPKDGVSHAADILCKSAEFRFAFLTAALPLFNRVGIGRDFIHVDDDPELPSNMVWVYDPSASSDAL
jgi:zinc D-Ala-D-Ala carboxypeptidase